MGILGAIPTGVVQSGILPEDVLKGNLDLDKRFCAAMSSEEPDAMDKAMECMYDSPDLCVLLGGDVLRGHDAVRTNIEGFKSSLPDVDLVILDIGHFQVGNTVFALGVAQYSFYDENRNPIGGFYELWSDVREEVNGTWVYLVDHVTIIPSYEVVATSVASTNTQPTGFSLDCNYPNPFNPTTTINYQLGQAGMVNLVIYDLLGRKVTTLVDEMKTPGSYEVNWNAENYSSGMYFCRLNLGDSKVLTQKMMLVK